MTSSNNVFNSRNISIVLSSNPDNLLGELKSYRNSATVEAEYGDVCVEGSVITLAHHGSRSWNNPPCVHPNVFLKLDVIGLSHVDLDSLGGVLALLSMKPNCEDFWEAAGKIDVNGAHKIDKLEISEENKLRLYSWWAWNENNKLFAPRDGSIVVVNDWIEKAYYAILMIVDDDKEMLDAGREFMERGKELNEESFVDSYVNDDLNVVLRESDSFVNHLYNGPDGSVYDIVVSFNTKLNSVTISKSDNYIPVNCRLAVQDLWGDKAGGHEGIAGSPRDRVMNLNDAIELIKSLKAI